MSQAVIWTFQQDALNLLIYRELWQNEDRSKFVFDAKAPVEWPFLQVYCGWCVLPAVFLQLGIIKVFAESTSTLRSDFRKIWVLKNGRSEFVVWKKNRAFRYDLYQLRKTRITIKSKSLTKIISFQLFWLVFSSQLF